MFKLELNNLNQTTKITLYLFKNFLLHFMIPHLKLEIII